MDKKTFVGLSIRDKFKHRDGFITKVEGINTGTGFLLTIVWDDEFVPYPYLSNIKEVYDQQMASFLNTQDKYISILTSFEVCDKNRYILAKNPVQHSKVGGKNA